MAKTKASGISGGGGGQSGGNAGGTTSSIGSSQYGWAASGPNGTLTKQDIKEIQEQAKAIADMLHDGTIDNDMYKTLNKDLADAYGISTLKLIGIKNGNDDLINASKQDGSGDNGSKSAKKNTNDQSNIQMMASNLSKASQANVDKLNGASGMLEYPDKSDAHISWYGPEDIRNKIGVGVSKSYASLMYSAIKSYTGSSYEDIRDAYKKAQVDGVSSLDSYEKSDYNKAKRLETFLSKGVKSGNEWNSGVTYRGVPFDSTTYNKIMNAKVGEYVDPNWGAPASWSTKIEKSRGFSGSTKGSSVIFCEVTGNHKGAVSIRGLSQYYSENEVLASSKTQYRKVGQKMEGNILLVYVESE